jgi:outer membrane translocation and assembly module TamA
LWASWSNDNLPLFRQYSLGGPGTLRGYDFDSISSPSMNKMLLMNVEWSTKLDDDFILGAFIDAGSIYPVGTPMNLDDISTDAGLSIMPDSEGSLRVDIAKPLSDKDAPIKVSFRLSRTI